MSFARSYFLLAIVVAVIILSCAFSPEAAAFTLSGSLTAQSSDGSADQFFFNCEGVNPCRGTFADEQHEAGCSNILGRADSIVVSGMNLSSPGSISGTVTLSNLEHGGKQTN